MQGRSRRHVNHNAPNGRKGVLWWVPGQLQVFMGLATLGFGRRRRISHSSSLQPHPWLQEHSAYQALAQWRWRFLRQSRLGWVQGALSIAMRCLRHGEPGADMFVAAARSQRADFPALVRGCSCPNHQSPNLQSDLCPWFVHLLDRHTLSL